MKTNHLKNKTALVTGASSGLGVDFARELASRGANLILVARREDALRAVAADMERQYGVTARAVSMDLAAPDSETFSPDPAVLFRINFKTHMVKFGIINCRASGNSCC
jgi:NADP-dependent 3-hydroxy acid dehydrogenase YdfG